jgi:peptidoglycan hydrolase-like protein with peptidoglycan-binding domain
MTFDPRAEARRTKWMMGIGGAVFAVFCVAASVAILTAPLTPARMAPAPALAVAVTESAPVPEVVVPRPAVAPSAALARDDIKEIQVRLLSFGFDPGPLDGDVGRATVAAVMNYQQQRGQPQTGQLDRALLDQLRQDPPPRVAPSQPQPPSSRTDGASQRTAGSSSPPPQQQRRSGGLDFVRDADARLSRWFQSLSR